jgi:FixJ family two-component response regulator
MYRAKPVHIVDSDSKRRAQIAFALAKGTVQTQVYESIHEFEHFVPASGFVLLNEDDGAHLLSELTEKIQARASYLPIAVYSASPRVEKVVTAIHAGALDYLEWPFDRDQVEAALERMEALAKSIGRQEALRTTARKKVDELSARERQVLVAVIDGCSNKAAASRLGISPRTVEIHRGNVIRKLGVGSSAEAVRLGLYAGLDAE